MEMASSAASNPNQGKATVQYGIHRQQSNFVGKTVRQVREERGKLWGVPNDANAFLGSQKLDEDYVIQENDAIEFHRKAGEKGV
jgi:hypothetical protein